MPLRPLIRVVSLLQGPQGKQVVNSMAKKLKLPTDSEGFALISTCRSDTSVNEALRAYRSTAP